MAEKLKKGEGGFAAKMPEIARRIKDVNRYKEQAAEHVGMAGKATKDVCEAQNVNKAAFTFVATCHRKESAEAIDRVLTLFALALGTGLLDQIDMFDDRLKFIQAELAKRTAEDAPRAAAPGASMVAQLSAVN